MAGRGILINPLVAMTTPGTFRESDGGAIAMTDAKSAWAEIARTVLAGVATTYNGLMSYGDLAEQLQARSGIRTRMMMHYWIGDVLGRVAQECHRHDEPLLSSLVVHADGTIGEGYGWALRETYGGPPPEDLDMQAAEERFKCYQHFGAPMPADGGRPALTPQVAVRRKARARKSVQRPQRPACPQCNLTLPATGQCDNCA